MNIIWLFCISACTAWIYKHIQLHRSEQFLEPSSYGSYGRLHTVGTFSSSCNLL